MAAWHLGLVAFWAMAVVLTLALFVELFGLHGWNWERVGVTVGTALVTFASIRGARDLRAWIRPLGTNLLEIGDGGIHLRIESEGEIRIAWPEISGIRFEKRMATTGGMWPIAYRVDDYVLTTARGPLSFTSMDIPGANRAAREISKRIQEAEHQFPSRGR